MDGYGDTREVIIFIGVCLYFTFDDVLFKYSDLYCLFLLKVNRSEKLDELLFVHFGLCEGFSLQALGTVLHGDDVSYCFMGQID